MVERKAWSTSDYSSWMIRRVEQVETSSVFIRNENELGNEKAKTDPENAPATFEMQRDRLFLRCRRVSGRCRKECKRRERSKSCWHDNATRNRQMRFQGIDRP